MPKVETDRQTDRQMAFQLYIVDSLTTEVTEHIKVWTFLLCLCNQHHACKDGSL